MARKKIDVVAAVIRWQDKFLVVQRNESIYDYISYKWEFPGGKIEKSEDKDVAILRELKEELLINVHSLIPLISIDHAYPDFDIIMHCFLCNVEEDNIVLMEHINKKWLTKDNLLSVDFAAADIPIVNYLLSMDHK